MEFTQNEGFPPDYKYFIPTSVGKYYIEHEQYRYILYKKVQAYKVLEMNKNVRNKYYLEQEFHDLTTRLFIGELMKKFSTKNRKNSFILSGTVQRLSISIR